tara:strand:+ start:1367 stop:2713 length:1347 start_codon:yes stop_codon:yes gene_type:complete
MFLVDFPNFTAEGEDFFQTAGTNIASTRPTVSLKMQPKPGYALLSGLFDPILPLPTGVASVAFVQGVSPESPLHVFCNITLDNPLTMPAAPLDLGLCITGDVIQKVYFNTVTVETELDSRITASKSSGTVSLNGTYNSTQTSNQTLTADAGYYLPSLPQAYVSTSFPANYEQSTTSSFDGNGYRLSTQITVDYLVRSEDFTTDKIKYVAQDVKPIPVTTVVQVNSYDIDVSSLTESGGVKQMDIRGVEGAAFSVNVVNSLSVNIFSYSSTINSVGLNSLNIPFPKITAASETYTITISGTLSATLTPTVFTLNQYQSISVGFGITSANGFIGSTASPTINPKYSADRAYSTSYLERYDYTVLIENPTGTLNNSTDIINFPTRNSFTNVTYTAGNGTEIFINSVGFFEYQEAGVVSTSKITMLISYSILSTGTTDIASTINIDNFLTFN